jgi:hypothetical protein
MALLGIPSDASRQIRARKATVWGVFLARTQASRVLFCSKDIGNAAVGFHMKPTLSQKTTIVKILLGHYTKENKKEIDQIIHELVNVPYKQCSPVWKAVKKQIKMDDKDNGVFVEKLKKRLGSGSRS